MRPADSVLQDIIFELLEILRQDKRDFNHRITYPANDYYMDGVNCAYKIVMNYMIELEKEKENENN